jgi:hypothetical protein
LKKTKPTGYLMECASPRELVEKKGSLFAQLVAEYWAQASRKRDR